MDTGEKTREVIETVEAFGRDGVGVRHLAYAKDTPPKWATWPTLETLHTHKIMGVGPRIISFEGIVSH